MNCYSLSCIVLFLPIMGLLSGFCLSFLVDLKPCVALISLSIFQSMKIFFKIHSNEIPFGTMSNDGHTALKSATSRILRGTIRHSFGHSSSSSVLSKTMIFCLEKKYCCVLFLQMIIRRRRGIVAPGPLAIGSPRDVARLKGMLLIRYCHPENQ